MESDNQGKHELRIPDPPGEPKRPVPPLAPTPTAAPGGAVQNLSTVELVREITAEVSHLARKEIELAKIELKEDLKSEAIAIGGLFVAGLGGIFTVNLLLVTAVFALAVTIPGWAAGLIISAIALAATASVAWLSWRRRVRKPMARTQRTIKDDVKWTKERLA